MFNSQKGSSILLCSSSTGTLLKKGQVNFVRDSLYSIAETEPPGAATFRVELEPIFLLAGAAAPAAFFWQAKKESLVIVKNMN